jgi:hypothetical protein
MRFRLLRSASQMAARACERAREANMGALSEGCALVFSGQEDAGDAAGVVGANLQ